jgi:hypothetical protein
MRKIGIVFICLLGWVLLSGPAFADFIHIPAASFTGDSSQLRVNNGYYLYAQDSIGSLHAPVELPHGAIIKSMRIFFLDNHATGDLEVHLYRRNLYNGDYLELFYLESSGASNTDRFEVDSTIYPAPSYRRVYNNACQYYIKAYFGGYGTTLRLYGVTIEYE